MCASEIFVLLLVVAAVVLLFSLLMLLLVLFAAVVVLVPSFFGDDAPFAEDILLKEMRSPFEFSLSLRGSLKTKRFLCLLTPSSSYSRKMRRLSRDALSFVLSLFLSSRRVIRIVRRGREKRESCDDEFNSEFCLLRVDFSTEREKREKRKKEFEGCPLVVLVLVDLKFLFESKKKEKKRFDVFDFR